MNHTEKHLTNSSDFCWIGLRLIYSAHVAVDRLLILDRSIDSQAKQCYKKHRDVVKNFNSRYFVLDRHLSGP